MDLSRWSKNNYRVTFWKNVLLLLGGHPYRCEYCRVNFVSFRRRKERYDPLRRKQQRKHRHTPEGAPPDAEAPTGGERSA